ncbi:Coiled-coil domain-containing protein 81 [Phlyctochytrium planicorne]|nr:Coiled-coil domain-containing protein 81 [Phlyctochytrium planicorne]
MDKLGFEDVVREVCGSISKCKRFSALDPTELTELWNDLTQFVHGQLLNRRSVNFPGIGCFYVRRVRRDSDDTRDFSVPKFVPARGWEKISGYHVSRNIIAGYAPAEHVNFSLVSQKSGLSKDDMESGLKDIVHAMFRVLKRGKNVVLPFAELGKLYFQHREIKLRFYPEFLEALGDDTAPIPIDRLPTVAEKPSASSSAAEALATKTNAKEENVKVQECVPAAVIERVPLPALIITNQESSEKREEKEESKNSTNSASGSAVSKEEHEESEAEKKEKLQLDLILNRGGKHTHAHSGDRLWSDIKCPICKHKNMPIIEVKEQLARKEKDQDKLLLHLSLEVDREYLRKSKAIDELKLKAAISTAQYNHSKALETELQRKKNGANLPMGNLFENRPPPPDRIKQAKELAQGLHDQMTIKQSRKLREKQEKESEDKELNEKFMREFKESEVQSHLEKLKRRHQQQEVLAEQIRAQAQRSEHVQEPVTENPFARSESLMFLYQKEKAKQLYQEQLAIIKQKREYESRIADIDRQHSLERLALSRKE